MRIFHLSDLHIGLKLINRDLREDQEYILDQIIQKDDKRKDEYYRRFTGEEWKDATQYDLCLDSSKLGYEKCIEEIENQLKLLK